MGEKGHERIASSRHSKIAFRNFLSKDSSSPIPALEHQMNYIITNTGFSSMPRDTKNRVAKTSRRGVISARAW